MIMGKATDFIKEAKANKTGYIDSLNGWNSIIIKATESVNTSFDRIERALKSEDSKQVKNSLGVLDSALDKLESEVHNVKQVTKSLLRDMEKTGIEGSDFWETKNKNEDTYSKEQLKSSMKCPICGGKLTWVKKFGKGNLASENVLHCNLCYSDF